MFSPIFRALSLVSLQVLRRSGRGARQPIGELPLCLPFGCEKPEFRGSRLCEQNETIEAIWATDTRSPRETVEGILAKVKVGAIGCAMQTRTLACAALLAKAFLQAASAQIAFAALRDAPVTSQGGHAAVLYQTVLKMSLTLPVREAALRTNCGFFCTPNSTWGGTKLLPISIPLSEGILANLCTIAPNEQGAA